jgi:ribosome-binding factor A
MKKDRKKRLAEQVKEELAKILLEEMQEDHFHFISIVSVKMPKDMRTAQIKFSTFGPDQSDDQKTFLIKEFLKNRSYFRKALSRRLNMRHTPSLEFVYDDSLEYAQKMSDILDNLSEDE